MQIKCDHLAPVRMATIKKSTDNTYWWGSGRKETLVHTEILQSLKKKNEILLFATMWMDLENILPSETSDRERYTLYYHVYAGYKK